MEKYGRARQVAYTNITRRLRIAFWVTNTTGTHRENLTFIAFTLQQWLYQSALLLRSMNNVCYHTKCDILLSLYPSSWRSTAASLACHDVSNSTLVSLPVNRLPFSNGRS
jgi:hypothetical protein